jgi:pyruvate/2-oxoglutarate dehydrogenase complex dihydrolipoamide dehydrogenase (E3) component
VSTALRDVPRVLPADDANRLLQARVHPLDWVNPEPAPRYNLVVIGAGTAGLVTAAAGAGLGARVALVEREFLGGDCLNVGCVPSKSIIRSARAVGEIGAAAAVGVRTAPPDVDFPAVMARMRAVRARIAEHDSAARFTGLGVDVFLGAARFTGPDTVEVGGRTLRFRRAVVATGARAAAPPVAGLAEAGFLTNETVFSLTRRPDVLAVVGGGPIGCELAQAFRRLGSDVVLLTDTRHLLPREDDDAAALVERALVADGVRLVLDARLERVERADGRKVLHYTAGGASGRIAADEILVGTGRQPNVDGLGLDAAGIAHDPRTGVRVDDFLRTTNPRVYAAGDVCLATKFTHAADFAARIVVQNALFLGRKRLSQLVMPWCTYTDPEVAHVGLSDAEAARRGVAIRTFTVPFADVDRALADAEEGGFVKLHVAARKDTILGATIVARHAGDMLNEITLAMVAGIGLGRLASVIHPYPTQAEAIRKAADAYNRTRLTPRVKRAFAAWLRWTR